MTYGGWGKPDDVVHAVVRWLVIGGFGGCFGRVMVAMVGGLRADDGGILLAYGLFCGEVEMEKEMGCWRWLDW